MHGKKHRNPGFKINQHWSLCDVCGFAYREKDLYPRWDGQVVCEEDWEPRHSQDLVRGVKDDSSPQGNIRPQQPNVFTSVTYDLNSQEDPTVPSGTFDNSL